MHKALEAAFRRTRYRVAIGPAGLVLRVDHREPRLAALLRDAGAGCAALLTAFNPHGRRATRFMNLRAQRRLARDLDAMGFRPLPGRNEDPRGIWPAEPTFFVRGMSEAAAAALAKRYAQAAFLSVDATGTPRLIAAAAPAMPTARAPRPTPQKCCPTRPAA